MGTWLGDFDKYLVLAFVLVCVCLIAIGAAHGQDAEVIQTPPPQSAPVEALPAPATPPVAAPVTLWPLVGYYQTTTRPALLFNGYVSRTRFVPVPPPVIVVPRPAVVVQPRVVVPVPVVVPAPVYIW